ncbi:MFS transporter [Thermodesulfobacteriota bacterium]
MTLSRKSSTVFYGWWVVCGVFFTGLYSGGAVFYGFTAFIEPIAKEFGWSYGQISIAASLRGLEIGILAPVLGILVDRWGPRSLMITGAIITGSSLILLSHITSLGMFYGVFIILCIGISPNASTVALTAVANWFRKKVALATGIVTSGVALGGFLVPLVTASMDAFGWRVVMVGLGIGMWVICLPLSVLVRHKPEQYGYLVDGEVRDNFLSGEGLSSPQPIDKDISAGRALRSRTFWHITVALMLNLLAVSAVMTHVMPYLSSINISRSISGLAAGGLPVVSICGRLGFGLFGDRFDKRWVSVASFIFITLGLLLFNYTESLGVWMLVPFLIMFGIGWGGNITVRAVLLREYFGGSRFGTILGLANTVLMLGTILGPAIAGIIFDKSGSYQGAWVFFMCMVILASVIITTTPPLPDMNQH